MEKNAHRSIRIDKLEGSEKMFQDAPTTTITTSSPTLASCSARPTLLFGELNSRWGDRGGQAADPLGEAGAAGGVSDSARRPACWCSHLARENAARRR